MANIALLQLHGTSTIAPVWTSDDAIPVYFGSSLALHLLNDLTFRRAKRNDSTTTRDVSIEADSSRKISILESMRKDKLIEEERAEEGSVINLVGHNSNLFLLGTYR